MLGDRIVHEPPPWSLESLVAESLSGGETMLDMGTGGGEWLSSLCRPARVVATEGWAPNVPVAAARLRPLGVSVVRDEGAIDNVDQPSRAPRGRLALRDRAFDVVVNRHEAFVAAEVQRVLRPGGCFLTQQTESGSHEFHRVLGLEPPPRLEFGLDLARQQLSEAGLAVERAGTGPATTTFADIGALAWYLSNVPWAVPGFSVATHRAQLHALHGSSIAVSSTRFWLQARRPS
ncbi:MAG TPA: methyltransferase domain-containing protein [Acidimicrobiales bacterium]|nr:methyltransferase domain-containing protein [Acidimicrobiales bacterium]